MTSRVTTPSCKPHRVGLALSRSRAIAWLGAEAVVFRWTNLTRRKFGCAGSH